VTATRTGRRTAGEMTRHDEVTPPGGDVADLHRQLAEQASLVAALQRCVLDLDSEVAELRSLLIRSQCEVIRRLGQLPAAPWAANDGPSPDPDPVPDDAAPDQPVAPQPALDAADYARLVDRTRALVRTVVPAGAVLAVVSRGDDRLTDVDGRVGWHFPRTADGRWAGHHPTDSAAAVAALEDLRRRGARYLVFPATARWWLDYYGGLRRHLDDTARLVLDRPETCTVYALDR